MASPTTAVADVSSPGRAVSGVRSALDGIRLPSQSERVAQQQRQRLDRRDRIGDALARNVGRGAVDRLVQAQIPAVFVALCTQRRARHQAHGACQRCCFIREDVPKKIVRDHHVERRGPVQQVHRQRIGENRRELHV
jgi:hypothetical protein